MTNSGYFAMIEWMRFDNDHVKSKTYNIDLKYRIIASATISNQPQCAEADMAVFSNDNMVVNGDAQRLGSVYDGLGHVDIGTRRCWIS